MGDYRNSHQVYLHVITDCDVDTLKKEESIVLDLRGKCRLIRSELIKIWDLTDVIPTLKSAFDELVKNNLITNDQMNSMIEKISSSYKTREVEEIVTSNGFIDYCNKLGLNFSENILLFNKIIDIGNKVDQMTNEKTLSSLRSKNSELNPENTELNNYISLMDQLTSNNQMLKQMDSSIKERINSFKPAIILGIDEINALCKHGEGKKTELMIIDGNYMDSDSAAVIQMRAKSAIEEGNEFVVMPFKPFHQMLTTEQLLNNVTKLSFLQHGSEIRHEFNYVSGIANYINHLPDLQEIVLRGCGTAEAPKKGETPTVYSVKIGNGYDNNTSIQGDTLVIQQKEDDGGNVSTMVSWKTKDKVRHEIKDIQDIPKIETGSKKASTEQLQALERINGMPLLQHENNYINSLRMAFFDKNKKITPDELRNAKKGLRRARTELVSSSQDDVLSRVLNSMETEQKNKISVKAYIGGYSVDQGRVIPDQDHGRSNVPKSVRVGFTRK